MRDSLIGIINNPLTSPNFTVLEGYGGMPQILMPLVCKKLLKMQTILSNGGYCDHAAVRDRLHEMELRPIVHEASRASGRPNAVFLVNTPLIPHASLEWLKHGGRLCAIPETPRSGYRVWVPLAEPRG